MNWSHLRTFAWMRWRLGVNQLRRSGFANSVLLAIITFGRFWVESIENWA